MNGFKGLTWLFMAFTMTAFVAGCGNWNGAGSTPKILTSIAVTPAIQTIPLAATQQYTATGTYSDNTTAVITTPVTWSSSQLGIATIDSSGLANGVAVGTTLIMAQSGSISSGPAILNVKQLFSIAVTPANQTILIAATQEYIATATYNDTTTSVITTSVSWSSNLPGIATINSSGLATGVAVGTTLITAESVGITSGPATLNVSAPPPPALAINLRSAEPYGIAARAGMSTTGVTVVNGNIALSPNGTCTDATGNLGASQTCITPTGIYTSPTGMTVNGKIFYAADPFDNGATASSVTNDLNLAWIEGMSKVNNQPAIAAGELGGKTFVPGIYENANLTLAAGSTATMNAGNNADAIFIFKVTLGGDLIDSGTILLPSQIKLINGAQARNVWFVVGRDITIGSGTKWFGNILANRTATVKNGSTVIGRVLAGAGGAGAVTLTGAASPSVTTITKP